MEPEPVLRGDAADFGERIETVGSRSADGGADEEGYEACGEIGADGGLEFRRAHGETLVDSYEAQVFTADAGDPDRFFDGRVGLSRGIGGQASVAAGLIAGQAGPALACGDDGAEGRAGG